MTLWSMHTARRQSARRSKAAGFRENRTQTEKRHIYSTNRVLRVFLSILN